MGYCKNCGIELKLYTDNEELKEMELCSKCQWHLDEALFVESVNRIEFLELKSGEDLKPILLDQKVNTIDNLDLSFLKKGGI